MDVNELVNKYQQSSNKQAKKSNAKLYILIAIATILVGVSIFLIFSGNSSNKTKTIVCEDSPKYNDSSEEYYSRKVELKFNKDENLIKMTETHITTVKDEESFIWESGNSERSPKPGVTERTEADASKLSIRAIFIYDYPKMKEEDKRPEVPTIYEGSTEYWTSLGLTCK